MTPTVMVAADSLVACGGYSGAQVFGFAFIALVIGGVIGAVGPGDVTGVRTTK